jgi:hypothetical protein
MATRNKQIIRAFEAFKDQLPYGGTSLEVEEIPSARRRF